MKKIELRMMTEMSEKFEDKARVCNSIEDSNLGYA